MRKLGVWAMVGLLLAVMVGALPGVAGAADGKQIYTEKCAPCHGAKGDGKGPLAISFNPPPGDFCAPKFWEGNVDKKISDTVTKGKGQMTPVKLTPDELKAVTEYITKSCKK
jgi:mono/diheme cytochrome c family protein